MKEGMMMAWANAKCAEDDPFIYSENDPCDRCGGVGIVYYSDWPDLWEIDGLEWVDVNVSNDNLMVKCTRCGGDGKYHENRGNGLRD